MNPSQQALDARLNPEAVTFKIPSTEGLFRAVGDYGSQLYRRVGNKIEAIDIIQLGKDALIAANPGKDQYGNYIALQNKNNGIFAEKAKEILNQQYGLNFDSLPEINIGDLNSTGGKQGLQVAQKAGPDGGPDNYVHQNSAGDLTGFLGAKKALTLVV